MLVPRFKLEPLWVLVGKLSCVSVGPLVVTLWVTNHWSDGRSRIGRQDFELFDVHAHALLHKFRPTGVDRAGSWHRRYLLGGTALGRYHRAGGPILYA